VVAYKPKVVLHSPVDETALEEFVDKCLRDGVVSISVVGDRCDVVEDLLDDLLIGDGSERRFIVTTAHVGESAEEVVEFVRTYMPPEGDPEVISIRPS
jgi:hypothetical protein